MIETDQQYRQAKERVADFEQKIAVRSADLKWLRRQRRLYQKDIDLWNARRQVADKS